MRLLASACGPRASLYTMPADVIMARRNSEYLDSLRQKDERLLPLGVGAEVEPRGALGLWRVGEGRQTDRDLET